MRAKDKLLGGLKEVICINYFDDSPLFTIHKHPVVLHYRVQVHAFDK